VLYYFSGAAWLKYSDSLNNITKLGINATADTTNKLSVNSGAILFNHNGTDVQVKVNKNAAGNSGSFLFQTGFSGRAEIGLTGDDDFHFKVSSNGSTYVEAIKLDKTTGALTIAGGAIIRAGTGTPEAVVTAPVGSIFLRTDGGASTTLYVKQSGSGNTGWTAK
jgi:hypothetical protein